ncbi:MAG: hypothetical protein ACI4JN_02295, partial [Ruminococcus sp.]
MNEMLMAVSSPFLAGLLGFAVQAVFRLPVRRSLFGKLLPENKPRWLRAGVTLLTTAIAAAVLLAVSTAAVSSFTAVERHISVWAYSAVSCLAVTAAMFFMADGRKMLPILGKIFIAASVLFVCEVFVFNLKSFGGEYKEERIPIGDAVISGECDMINGKIVVRGFSEIVFNSPPGYAKGLILDMTQEEDKDSTTFEITASIKDKNFSDYFQVAQDKFTMGYGRPLTMTINPYEELYGLKLALGSIAKPVTINEVKAVSRLPFAFSCVRYFVLLALAAAVIIIKELRLYKAVYKRNSIKHNIILQAAALALTFSALVFQCPNQEIYSYDEPAAIGISDPYSMTFDALMKGQPYLDIEPDEKLAELENPYDTTMRDAASVFYHWDYAYYEGHYYCYFGIAPVIAFYFPFYMITGKVPTMAMASLFFGVLAVFFFCQTLIALCRRLLPKINMLLMLLFMAAGVSCAGMYTCMNQVNRYNLPIAAGMCFLMLCLWLGITACSSKSVVMRCIMLLFSGTALAFCAAARPGMTLCSLILVPLFIGILAEKNRKVILKAAQAVSFLIPVGIGALLIMKYNTMRFGSPLDFGAAYQLTVSDVHANKLQLRGIFPAIYHYFFQVPRPKASFPFFEAQFASINNYTKYTYIDAAIGAFTYPLIVLGMMFVPMAASRKGIPYADRGRCIQRKWVLTAGVAVAFFMAWQEFCMAGVIDRYILDILPILTLCSVVAVIYAAGKSKGFGIRYK